MLYGEYETVDDAYGNTTGDFELWGVGVVQEIDAAAMSLWLSYRNIEADNDSVWTWDADFQYVKFGALINF